MYPLTTLFNALEGSHVAWPSAGCDRSPRADIYEGDKDFRIVMDMPGVRNQDLVLDLDADTLNIKAERVVDLPQEYKAHRRELMEKCTFHRSFTLGSAVDTDKIQANLQDGVLTITLPKNQKSLPRRIEVK